MTNKGEKLLKLYKEMVNSGYQRVDGEVVDDPFCSFELRPFRCEIFKLFKRHGVKTVLDYGSGGANWFSGGFDTATGQSAADFFNLTKVRLFEPSRMIDERLPSDAVICFDVLEHVFVADIPGVVRDLYSYSTSILIVNVACYPAQAILPNGENAHVTIRSPFWWKGLFDVVSTEFPHIRTYLLASTQHGVVKPFRDWSAQEWLLDEKFGVDY